MPTTSLYSIGWVRRVSCDNVASRMISVMGLDDLRVKLYHVVLWQLCNMWNIPDMILNYLQWPLKPEDESSMLLKCCVVYFIWSDNGNSSKSCQWCFRTVLLNPTPPVVDNWSSCHGKKKYMYNFNETVCSYVLSINLNSFLTSSLCHHNIHLAMSGNRPGKINACMRHLLSWDIMRCWLVVSYSHFGTGRLSQHIVSNCQSTLRNTPEEQRPRTSWRKPEIKKTLT